MGTSFSWGFPDEQTLQQNAGAPADASLVIREALRENATSSYFPPQNASPTAQNSGGLGIQNVKRGFLDLTIAYDPSVVGTDFQTTSTAYERVGTELAGSVVTSGRPLLLLVRGNAGISAGYATFSVLLNGTEVTGANGMARVFPSNQETFSGLFIVAPPAGTQNLAMVWKTSTGSTVLMPRSSRPSLIAVEI